MLDRKETKNKKIFALYKALSEKNSKPFECKHFHNSARYKREALDEL
jgi:hypothetical protein